MQITVLNSPGAVSGKANALPDPPMPIGKVVITLLVLQPIGRLSVSETTVLPY